MADTAPEADASGSDAEQYADAQQQPQAPSDPMFAGEDLNDEEVQRFVGGADVQVKDWARAHAILERGSFTPEELGDGDAITEWLFEIALSLTIRAAYLVGRGRRGGEIKPERYDQELDRLTQFEELGQLLLEALSRGQPNQGQVQTRAASDAWSARRARVNDALNEVADFTRPQYVRFQAREALARRGHRGNYGPAGARTPSPQRGGSPPSDAGQGQQGPRPDAYAVKALSKVHEDNRFDHTTDPFKSPPYHVAALMSRVNQEMEHANNLAYVSVKLTGRERAQYVLRHLSDASSRRYHNLMESYQGLRLTAPFRRRDRDCVFVPDLIHVWDFDVSQSHPKLRLRAQDCRSFPELLVVMFPAGLSAQEVHQRYVDAKTKFDSDGTTPPDQVFAELTQLASAANSTGQLGVTVSILDIRNAVKHYISRHRSQDLLTAIEREYEVEEAGQPENSTNHQKLFRFVTIAKQYWEASDRASALRERSQALQRFDRLKAPRGQVFALSEQDRRRAFNRHQVHRGKFNGNRLNQVEETDPLDTGLNAMADSPVTGLNAMALGDDQPVEPSHSEGVDFLAFADTDAVEADNLWGEDNQVQLLMAHDTVELHKLQEVNSRRDSPRPKLCFRCHQPGHFIANCPFPARGDGSLGKAATSARIFRRRHDRLEPATLDAKGRPVPGPDGALYVLSRESPAKAYQVYGNDA